MPDFGVARKQIGRGQAIAAVATVEVEQLVVLRGLLAVVDLVDPDEGGGGERSGD